MEYNIPHNLGNQWKLPVNLAIIFHLLIALSAVYLPELVKSKPRYKDIYTVSLINITASPTPQPITPPQTATPAKEPPPSKKAVALTKKPVKPVKKAPKRAVSIKPKRYKIKKKIPAKPTQPTHEELRKKQQLEEVLRAQQEAEKELQRLREEVARERQLIKQGQDIPISPQTSVTETTTSPATRGQGGSLSAVEKQYYTLLTARLQSLWSLPEYKSWDPNLNASVVITIRKNGEIADHFFEKKSGDKIFDRFVMKTLSDVGNLPPIPPALKKQRLEIGLIFSPGQIH